MINPRQIIQELFKKYPMLWVSASLELPALANKPVGTPAASGA
jgi:hypothetical protein